MSSSSAWAIISRRSGGRTLRFHSWARCPSASACRIRTLTTMSHSWPLPGPTPHTVAASAAVQPRVLGPGARAERVMARCDELAAFTEEPGRITRSYGTLALTAARDLIAQWMGDAGLAVRVDAVGNVRGRGQGSAPTAPALLLGSHFDSVRDAGRYDGPLGILVALEVVDHLRHRPQPVPFPVEVIAFADEEGLRFQTTYLGSCALAGSFDAAFLDLVDENGVTLSTAMEAFGGDPDALAATALQAGEALAYLEVHIEQGPFL